MYKGENAGNAGVGTTDCLAAGAWRLCTDLATQVEVIIMGACIITRFPLLCTDVSTEVEVIIMGTGSITGFPLLNTVFSAHVEASILCAEVRAGDGGGAVFIAVTIISLNVNTKTVHLGAAPLPAIRIGKT